MSFVRTSVRNCKVRGRSQPPLAPDSTADLDPMRSRGAIIVRLWTLIGASGTGRIRRARV